VYYYIVSYVYIFIYYLGIKSYDYLFAENGLVSYKNGQLLEVQVKILHFLNIIALNEYCITLQHISKKILT